MASITSSGIGSGLDINSIVSQLIAAERKPVETRLTLKETEYQAKLSAYGMLKSAVSKFQSAAGKVASSSAFNVVKASSSKAEIVSASAVSTAQAGSYTVEVKELAQAHALASTTFESASTVVGTGTLIFRYGSTDYDPDTDTYTSFTENPDTSTRSVVIDSTNNTLSGVRDAINKANIGVQASIVNDGNGYRLVFARSYTGADQSMEITVADGDGNSTDTSGLSALAFNSSATNMTQTLAARDSEMLVNGLTVTNSSNIVSDAINGVTLTLNKAEVGTKVTVSVAKDTTSAADAIKGFVSAYNELNTTLRNLGRYDAATEKAGPLVGDPLLRDIQSKIRAQLLPQGAGLAREMSLAEMGIKTVATETTGSDGKTLVPGSLQIDDAALTKALEERAEEVVGAFAAVGRASDSNIKYLSSTSATKAGWYLVDITQPATQGVFTGAAIAGYAGSITIGADNKTFDITLDGVNGGSVTLDEGTYTGAELAAQMQSRINGLSAFANGGKSITVSFDTDHFVFTSGSFGSGSKIEFTAIGSTAGTTLGLSVAAGDAGVDVAGTIGGKTATGSGRTLTGAASDVEGLAIEVTATAAGSYGSVKFERGIGDRLNRLLSGYLTSDGPLDSKETTMEERLEEIAEAREALEKRMEALEERYRAQFTAMDALVGQLKATSNFLTQQLSALQPRKE